MTSSTTTNSATPVWNIPVNVMDFLKQADVFCETLSTITTLRLCNRFGKGENAYIVKLSKEILGLIEDEFMARARGIHWSRWPGEYCCFEGTCRPSDHIYHRRYESLREEALEFICDNHRLDYETLLSTSVQDLPDGVMDLVAIKADRLCAGNWAGLFDGIIERELDWSERIVKGKGETFRQYEELLLKHFGLEVSIVNEILKDEARGYILRNDNRFMKNRTPPTQVTICHLVIPTQPSNGASDSDDLESHRKRFAQAMNVLNLKPTVHPNLLDDTSSAASPDKAHDTTQVAPATSTSEVEKKDAVTKQRIKDLENSQWPKS